MASDDAAGLLLRYDGGARGVCTVSQVSAGRKNDVSWEVDGADAALAWQSTDPERLWIGHRGRAERARREGSDRDDGGRQPPPRRSRPDTSRDTRTRSAPCSARCTPTSPPAAPSAAADVPDVRRRTRVVAVCEAIAESARTGAWAPSRRRWRSTRGSPRREHPMKLGLLTAAFPDTPLGEVAEWASCQRVRMPRGGVLATRRGGRAPLRRRVAHRLRQPLRDPGEGAGRRARRAEHQISALGYYPNPLTRTASTGPRSTAT